MNRLLKLSVVFILILSIQGHSQFLKAPPIGENQFSSITQGIGITKINITYNSPDVNGRRGKIWKELVPYEKVWRAGANENTTITFSHDVKVQGKEIKAGTYGLFMIPDNEEWVVIFSSNNTSWGTFVYNESEDILRISTQPKESSFTEWLTFDFIERKPNYAILALKWEDLMVPLRIDVNQHSIVLDSFKKELNGGTHLFFYEGRLQAATYCLDNTIELEQGLKWVNESIDISANFNNVIVKYKLLKKLNRFEAANEAHDFALQLGTPQEIYYYGRQLIDENNLKQAFDVMNFNYKKHGGSIWPTHLGMGRIYDALKNTKYAIKHYNKALKIAKLKRQQVSINKLIKRIEL